MANRATNDLAMIKPKNVHIWKKHKEISRATFVIQGNY